MLGSFLLQGLLNLFSYCSCYTYLHAEDKVSAVPLCLIGMKKMDSTLWCLDMFRLVPEIGVCTCIFKFWMSFVSLRCKQTIPVVAGEGERGFLNLTAS